ncbi:hypothetical protein TRVL_08622 [Trypanosoma vivax]|uniref:CSD domain-containing protein n=1 Tax=Trypanosoma vivax (strain Y486) TaxID=1055687 RepID=G0TZT3_TRYVY|nr:hypothetical protein TRVL_08622 [Trypanosoma vivax]CCC50111.1 conserved hypothetical protein [Trypanosoma vivax Y486]
MLHTSSYPYGAAPIFTVGVACQQPPTLPPQSSYPVYALHEALCPVPALLQGAVTLPKRALSAPQVYNGVSDGIISSTGTNMVRASNNTCQGNVLQPFPPPIALSQYSHNSAADPTVIANAIESVGPAIKCPAQHIVAPAPSSPALNAPSVVLMLHTSGTDGLPMRAHQHLSYTEAQRCNGTFYEVGEWYEGVVKRYNPMRGFGFLTATHHLRVTSAKKSVAAAGNGDGQCGENTSNADTSILTLPEVLSTPVKIGDVFVHQSYIQMQGFRSLEVGDRVVFRIGVFQGKNHRQAVSVQRVCSSNKEAAEVSSQKEEEAALKTMTFQKDCESSAQVQPSSLKITTTDEPPFQLKDSSHSIRSPGLSREDGNTGGSTKDTICCTTPTMDERSESGSVDLLMSSSPFSGSTVALDRCIFPNEFETAVSIGWGSMNVSDDACEYFSALGDVKPSEQIGGDI